jgi:futalosine hydrolase
MPPRPALLILAAHEPELAPLRARLSAAGRDAMPAYPVGVGLAAAAAGTARLLAELHPVAVLLTGSAGLYPGHGELRPAEVVVGTELRLLDAACLQGQAALPAPIRAELHTEAGARAGWLAAGASRAVAVGTTLGITTDDGLAVRLGRLGRCVVETLEAQGAAQACHDAGVPISVLLGVTNLVGSQGRAQWLAHNRAAAEACAEVIERWLAGG